jgi:hypothetical protein
VLISLSESNWQPFVSRVHCVGDVVMGRGLGVGIRILIYSMSVVLMANPADVKDMPRSGRMNCVCGAVIAWAFGGLSRHMISIRSVLSRGLPIIRGVRTFGSEVMFTMWAGGVSVGD